MIKLLELFSGYGSQSMALRDAGIPFKIVGISEIDKYAIVAHEAVHGKVKNFGDITKIDETKLPDHNILTYSFPCTDLSVAGKQAGLEKGTRSGLLWECERIISHNKPLILLMENVKNLVGKKFKPDFDRWCKILEEMGYTNHWQVLNAKEHGIPQNRERVFMVSILDGFVGYEFPEKEELKIFLKDILEDEVPENFYLKPEQYSNLLKNLQETGRLNTNPSGKGMNGNVSTGDLSPTLTTNKGEGLKIVIPEIQHVANTDDRYEQNARIYGDNGVAPTITARDYKDPRKILRYERTEYGKEIRKDYESGRVKEKIGNMRVPVPREDGISNTLTTVQKDNHLLEGIRVRKLTPLECFRLMDVKDEDFYKIKKALNDTFYKGKDRSNSQLYKLAGNSIVVRPLMKIFKNLLT